MFEMWKVYEGQEWHSIQGVSGRGEFLMVRKGVGGLRVLSVPFF